MARRTLTPISSPSLFPFLSILTCTSGVLAFIILAIGFISVSSPSVVVEARDENRKQPIYVECHDDYLLIHPQRIKAVFDSILVDDSVYMQFLQRVAENAEQEYVVFAIFPQGEKSFRRAKAAVENLNEKNNFLSSRQIDIGYEPLNRNWRLEIKTKEGANEKAAANQQH